MKLLAALLFIATSSAMAQTPVTVGVPLPLTPELVDGIVKMQTDAYLQGVIDARKTATPVVTPPVATPPPAMTIATVTGKDLDGKGGLILTGWSTKAVTKINIMPDGQFKADAIWNATIQPGTTANAWYWSIPDAVMDGKTHQLNINTDAGWVDNANPSKPYWINVPAKTTP